MRWPIWFGSNASIQRGAPTPDQAYGQETPTGIRVGGDSVIISGGNRPGEFPYPQDYATIQRGAPPITPLMGRHDGLWNLPPDPIGAYHVLRPYDWGAAGFGYIAGQVTTNPIGAGVVATNRVGVATREPGAVAQMLGNAVIFYSQQMQNYGIQPTTSPLLPPDILAQMAGPLAAPSIVPDTAIQYLEQQAQAGMLVRAVYG